MGCKYKNLDLYQITEVECSTQILVFSVFLIKYFNLNQDVSIVATRDDVLYEYNTL